MAFLKFPKCAVIGCGNWGGNLVRTLSSLGALGGIVEKNEARALELSKSHHVPVFEFEEILKNLEIEAIFIATTSIDRGSMVEKAFLNQKHVFIEKPIAFTAIEAQGFYAHALEAQRYIMAGHLLLYHPVFKKMVKMVKNGELGRIHSIKTERKNFGKFFKNENALWDFGPHDLSMILALLPEKISKTPKKVQKDILYARDGIEDICESFLEFSGGITVQMSLSRLSPYKEQRIMVFGEKGFLTFDDTKPWGEKLLHTPIFLNKTDLSEAPIRGEDKFIKVGQEEPLKSECLSFLEAIQSGEKPDAFLEAIHVIHILEMLQV